jgi:hypothetical protein
MERTSGDGFDHVHRRAIAPDGKVLLAATRTGLFRKEGESASWTRVRDEKDPMDVRFHPRSSSQAVARTRQGTALYSRDGGKTWSEAELNATAGGSAVRVELAYAVADPNLVSAWVDQNKGTVSRSREGGKSYQKQHDPVGYLGYRQLDYSLGGYGPVVWAGDPTPADLVLVGGVDLWRSSDGGKQCTKISDCDMPQSAPADRHWIVSHLRFDGKDNKTPGQAARAA